VNFVKLIVHTLFAVVDSLIKKMKTMIWRWRSLKRTEIAVYFRI